MFLQLYTKPEPFIHLYNYTTKILSNKSQISGRRIWKSTHTGGKVSTGCPPFPYENEIIIFYCIYYVNLTGLGNLYYHLPSYNHPIEFHLCNLGFFSQICAFHSLGDSLSESNRSVFSLLTPPPLSSLSSALSGFLAVLPEFS